MSVEKPTITDYSQQHLSWFFLVNGYYIRLVLFKKYLQYSNHTSQKPRQFKQRILIMVFFSGSNKY